MKFISLGHGCSLADILNKLCIREESFPFDWYWQNIESIYNLLCMLLNENIEISELVDKHLFNIIGRCNLVRCAEHITSETGSPYSSHGIFPHDEKNQETIDKYTRRFERLKKYIIDDVPITLLYTLPNVHSFKKPEDYSLDNQTLISDLKYINKIHEVITSYNKNCKFVVFGITDFTFDKGIELVNIENDLPQCISELMHKIHTLAS